MRIFYILILSSLLTLLLLWLGIFEKLKKKYAAIISAVIMTAAGVLLALAVLPGNSFYGDVLTHKAVERKVIALTFDDGPYPPYTQQLLQVLQDKNVHATFFMVGENAAKHPEIVEAVQKSGHEIALHAGKHQDLLKLDAAELQKNIATGKSSLEAITGTKIRFIRPPHGFKDWQTASVIQNAGLTMVNWSIIPRDWTNPGADTIAARVVNHVKPGDIVLLHDGDSPKMQAPREQTVAATAKIIDQLRAQGYDFVTVGELTSSK